MGVPLGDVQRASESVVVGGLASAVSGAGACALLALLISRSGADLLRSVPALTEKIGFQTENLLCLAAGISGGLLLAFSPVLWSQSVIVEVYSLNALFQMIVLLLIYMWMCRPKSDALLFVAAFLFGLGLTNHQTLLFLGMALAVAVVMKDADLFRDFAIAAVLLGIVFVFAAKGSALFASEAEKADAGVRRQPVEVVAGAGHAGVLGLQRPVFGDSDRAGVRAAARQDGVRDDPAGGAGRGVLHVPADRLGAESADELGLSAHVGRVHARGDARAVRGDRADGHLQRKIHPAAGRLSDGLAQPVFAAGGGAGLPAVLRVGAGAGREARSVFPVALGLVLVSSALIVLETAGLGGFEKIYRLLIAPVLLLAGGASSRCWRST
jgi:hypothetical protein